MSWQSITNSLIRDLIGDVDTPQVYTDSRLTQVAITCAHLVLNEVSFVNDYTVDVAASSISPDPSVSPEDVSFLNLLALRSSLLIANSEFKTSAKQSFIVKDGPSQIDTGNRYKALADFAKVAKEAYDKAKIDYIAGNSIAACAILTPFYYRGEAPNMFGSSNSTNRN
jgi:hypothetical protein